MEEIIPNKCYNCGKVFRDEHNFKRHKERKTACLIREINETDLKNPNRCIYCNKIFSKKENLTRHHKTCKVKNGGLNVLYDKTRYEEQIRIIKEEKDQEIEALEHKMQKMHEDHAKQMQEMMERMSKLEQKPTAVNNTVNNVNNVNIDNSVTIQINNYDKPNRSHLLEYERFKKMLEHEQLRLPVALVFDIYFDERRPANASVHIVDKETKHVIAMINGRWSTITLEKILMELREIGYNIAAEGYLKYRNGGTDEQKREIIKHESLVIGALRSNLDDPSHVKCDIQEIEEKLIAEIPRSAVHPAVIMEKERVRQAIKAAKKLTNK